jgi:hypothetical protein
MRALTNKQRIDRMRRSGILKGLFDDINQPIIKWAETKDELEQAFSLVHEEYLRLGYIKKPDPSKIHFSVHNLLPNSASLVVESGRQVISTLSIVRDHELFGLPMDEVFNAELNKLRKHGRRLCEFGALATSKNFCWRNLFMQLFREMFWYTADADMNDICIMVNPKHVPFYKTILLFDDLGAEKFYPRLGAPAVALRMNLDTYEERLKKAYSVSRPDCSLYHFVYRSQTEYFDNREFKRKDENIIEYFLNKKKNILENLSPRQKYYVYAGA